MSMSSSAVRQAIAQGRSQPVYTPYNFAAPVGGLNTKDAIAAMPETDAQIMDNMFPQPTWVEIRGGKQAQATFTGNCETLMPWVGILSTTPQLFAAVNNAGSRNVYRVDNTGGGAVGAPVLSGLSSTNFDYNQFGTGAGEFLLALNGIDSPYIYDGTTWQAVTASSTPYAWTSGPSPLSSLSQVAVYKNRLWFVQKNTMNVYYLPQNVVGGAMTQLNMGPLFKLGGFLSAIITVSIDNSAGTNDYIAFLSNQGELVQFQGYDPASVSTWSEAAHYRLGSPIGTGRACWQKMGMDAAIICQDGLILLSDAMLTDRAQAKETLSDKVRFGINQAIGLNGTYLGWQVLLYPAGNKLLLNVPTNNARTASYTYVMNTLTGAWCTWGYIASSFNAGCYENFNNLLYYGGPNGVWQCDTGQSDAGQPINWACFCAFNYFGSKTQGKRFSACKPYFQTSGALGLSLQMNIDFNMSQPTGTVPISTAQSAVWNVALWNTTYWGDAQQVTAPWIGLQGEGFCGALYIRGSTSGVTAKWMATTVLFEQGGALYGK